jgi:hypothetical protein
MPIDVVEVTDEIESEETDEVSSPMQELELNVEEELPPPKKKLGLHAKRR